MPNNYLKITSIFNTPKPSRWTRGIGLELPQEYKKFWKEWKLTKPAPVHYIEKKGSYERNPKTGEVFPVQNVPLPLKQPDELHQGIWGGEAVIQGFVKRAKERRRVPHFWFPSLKRSVVYSEVLNEHMVVIVTNRALRLIHENYGFDHYLLKTPACDLRSLLALKLKRNILIALADQTLYPSDEEKRQEVYDTYKEYLNAYTREEIEWYGLSWREACLKHINIKAEKNKPVPLKIKFRSELIAKLKENNIPEAQGVEIQEESKSSWMTKINPFSKNAKVD